MAKRKTEKGTSQKLKASTKSGVSKSRRSNDDKHDSEERLDVGWYRIRAIIDERRGRYLVAWEGKNPKTTQDWPPSWTPKNWVTASSVVDWEKEKCRREREELRKQRREQQEQERRQREQSAKEQQQRRVTRSSSRTKSSTPIAQDDADADASDSSAQYSSIHSSQIHFDSDISDITDEEIDAED